MGLNFSETPKTLFLTKVPQKTHILTQLNEIYRLVRDLTIFEEKNFGNFLW
jgi:hypothetical protein